MDAKATYIWANHNLTVLSGPTNKTVSDTDFPSWPSFSEEEADAVRDTLLSNRVNYWTGDQCGLFEKEFAEFINCKYAIALSNGTLALEIALRACGIGHGDDVIVTPRSFIASASTAITVGARPVFADIDRDSQNITAESIAAVLTPQTRAIVVVHLAGMPADMDPIIALAEEHGLYVIEDCAQAHGATYKGRAVGTIGHIGVWSFCQEKIMTTGGEGGMITTNDHELWSAAWSYKDHGKSWETLQEPASTAHFRWLHESIGTNARMLEMQAALGRYQLTKMPEWTKLRRKNADRIRKTMSQFKALRVPEVPESVEHAYYKLYVFVKAAELRQGETRDTILSKITSLGVPCYVGSCPEIYLEKVFDGTDLRPAQRLPVAQELGETSLMFQVHPTLQDKHIDRTCAVLNQVMGEVSLEAQVVHHLQCSSVPIA